MLAPALRHPLGRAVPGHLGTLLLRRLCRGAGAEGDSFPRGAAPLGNLGRGGGSLAPGRCLPASTYLRRHRPGVSPRALRGKERLPGSPRSTGRAGSASRGSPPRLAVPPAQRGRVLRRRRRRRRGVCTQSFGPTGAGLPRRTHRAALWPRCTGCFPPHVLARMVLRARCPFLRGLCPEGGQGRAPRHCTQHPNSTGGSQPR